MSSGGDLWQMCRRSSGFDSERSPRCADGTEGVAAKRRVCERVLASARV